MPALATLTLVWLGAQGPTRRPPRPRALGARPRRKLEAPRPHARRRCSRQPTSLAERCETWLEQARDQLQAGTTKLPLALGRARSASAPTPRALAGELAHGRTLPSAGAPFATRVARRSAALRAARRGHEGARAPGFGEPAPRAPRPPTSAWVWSCGARRHEIIGTARRRPTIFDSSGRASFARLSRRARGLGRLGERARCRQDRRLGADADACSAEDFEGVTLESKTLVSVPPGVRCPDWVAVAPLDRAGALTIAMCSGDRCQPGRSPGRAARDGAGVERARCHERASCRRGPRGRWLASAWRPRHRSCCGAPGHSIPLGIGKSSTTARDL